MPGGGETTFFGSSLDSAPRVNAKVKADAMAANRFLIDSCCHGNWSLGKTNRTANADSFGRRASHRYP
jgi:hypothetical protein